MYYLYILKSIKNNRYYIGSTNNIERRIVEHNSGKTKSLKHLIPVKLVFKKEFEIDSDAKTMERKLKKFKNRSILESIIKEQRITMGP